MKLGMSSAAFYGKMETEDQASHLLDFDLEVCEVFLETYSEYNTAFGQEIRRRLGKLPCVSTHPKGTQYEPDIFGRSKRQIADSLGLFALVCDAGQAMGARYYVMHGPGNVRKPVPPEKVNALQERFALMREIAAARGMEVLWENVSWCTVRTPEQVHSVKQLLPGIGFVLDVKQAWEAGVSPWEMASAMGENLRHLHLLDRNADGKLCLPGQGETDWQDFFRHVKDLGFDGAAILEPYGWHVTDEDALRRSLDHLREAMAKA